MGSSQLQLVAGGMSCGSLSVLKLESRLRDRLRSLFVTSDLVCRLYAAGALW